MSKRPDGPYVLAVHGSAGVPSCWECAHALVAQGKQISRIVVLDGCRPSWRFAEDADKFEKLLKKKGAAAAQSARSPHGKVLGDGDVATTQTKARLFKSSAHSGF